MANPQSENGHIDIANEIGEALSRINFSAYESRILWVIWRKTYGTIINELEKRGILSPDGVPVWNKATLSRLIHNPIYAGQYYPLRFSSPDFNIDDIVNKYAEVKADGQ